MTSNGDNRPVLDGLLGEMADSPLRIYRSPHARMVVPDRDARISRLVELPTARSTKRALPALGPEANSSLVLDEPTDADWIGKLRSAVASYERVGADMVRVLAARAAVSRHLAEVLDLWSDAIERMPKVAVAIGQALPHLFDAVTESEAERPRVVKLFGQSLIRAHSLDKRGGAEFGTLAQALLAADMSIPSAHPSVIEIIRAHSSILASDTVTWSYLAPYA